MTTVKILARAADMSDDGLWDCIRQLRKMLEK